MLLSNSTRLLCFFVLAFFCFLAPFLLDRHIFTLFVFLVLCISVCLINKKNFVARFYLVVFGVFFVLPPVILGEEDYLREGTFLKEVFLTADQAFVLQVILLIFILSFLFSSFFKVRIRVSDAQFRSDFINPRLYMALVLCSFFVIVFFNINEALAIYEQGYVDFQKGDVSVKKGMLILFVEVFFLCLVSVGLSRKVAISLWLVSLYSISLVFTGVRMPGACLLVLSWLYYHNWLRYNLTLLIVSSFLFAPPLLMFTQHLRVYGFSAFEVYDFFYGYYDLFKVLGFTIDTLKASIYVVDIGHDLNISPLFKFYHVIGVFLERVLSVNVDFGYASFGPEVTKYFDYELFESTGTTVSSSSIAEAWYYLRWLGVVALGVCSYALCSMFSFFAYHRGSFFALLYITFLPRLIMSVRNELAGWFFEGLIFLALSIPFFLLCKFLFLRRNGLNHENC